jgi:hypothetical protein
MMNYFLGGYKVSKTGRTHIISYRIHHNSGFHCNYIDLICALLVVFDVVENIQTFNVFQFSCTSTIVQNLVKTDGTGCDRKRVVWMKSTNRGLLCSRANHLWSVPNSICMLIFILLYLLSIDTYPKTPSATRATCNPVLNYFFKTWKLLISKFQKNWEKYLDVDNAVSISV